MITARRNGDAIPASLAGSRVRAAYDRLAGDVRPRGPRDEQGTVRHHQRALADSNSRLAQKKIKDFGSIEAWQKDFRAVGAMRGIGWAVLYQDNVSGRLFNCWINEHDGGHPAGCMPILVMDVFEHAYMLDYGLKRADYIETFFKNIDWNAVEIRLK